MNLKKFQNLISKKSFYCFYLFFFSYAVFFAFKLSITSDAGFYVSLGKSRLDYLLSLGLIKEKLTLNQEAFPAIYLTFVAFISDFFSRNLAIQIFYILNFVSSSFAAVGVYKLSKLLFNKQIALYTFVFFFFFSTFFGHMQINGRDTMILFCNIWVAYFSIKYLDFNYIKNKKYVIYLSSLVAVGMGVRFHFIATLIPLFFYIFYKIYMSSIENKIIFFKDLLKIILFSSLIVFIFWEPVHSNFILKIQEIFNYNILMTWGWPYNMINGNIFLTTNSPLNYIIELLFYKSPEYIIFLYIIFFIFLIPLTKKIKEEVKEFNQKIIFILINIFYPTLLLFFFKIQVYDGLRLFLFLIPYFVIIPAVTFYYLINNFSKTFHKLILAIFSVLFFYYMYSFSVITPYQYIYVNSFAGKFSSLNNKFENDYWAISLKELTSKIKSNEEINQKNQVRFLVCGLPAASVKYSLNNLKEKINFKIVRSDENPDYVILNNRTLKSIKEDVVHTCFKEYTGRNLVEVRRRNLVISAIKEVN